MSNLIVLLAGRVDVIVGVIILLAVIVIFVSREHYEHKINRDFLNGYWEASKTFCAKSGLIAAQIYIKDGKAYILLDEGDRVVLNKCVDIDLSPDWWDGEEYSSWRLKFSEPVDPLPQSCELRVDILNGMIGLFVDDTLYLEAYKDNRATANVV